MKCFIIVCVMKETITYLFFSYLWITIPQSEREFAFESQRSAKSISKTRTKYWIDWVTWIEGETKLIKFTQYIYVFYFMLKILCRNIKRNFDWNVVAQQEEKSVEKKMTREYRWGFVLLCYFCMTFI